MKFQVFVFSLILLWVAYGQSFQETDQETKHNYRHKRSVILLPENTSITVTFDLSMPIYALTAQAGFYNMRVPFRFFIPTYNQLTSSYSRVGSYEESENEIEQIHQMEQERANEERRFIYKNVESLLSSFGVDGMACVQRAICELSEAPIGHNDLLGNTLSLLFTPPRVANFGKWIMGRLGKKLHADDRGEEKCADCDEATEDAYHDEYVTAYYHGKKGNCAGRYEATCPISFFKMFNL